MRATLYEIINSGGTLSTAEVLLRIAVSVLLGMVVFLSYRITHSGAVYSTRFNITLLTLTVLTATVMTVIGNNVALSLGMVGALSIVRFRTSIKDSRDTVYIFWTIIIGICCGVGDFTVGAIGSGAVFGVLLLFGRVRNENRLLLLLRLQRSSLEEVQRILFAYFPRPIVLRAENTTPDSAELIYELNRRVLTQAQRREEQLAAAAERAPRSIIEQLYAAQGVEYVNLIVQSDEIS